MKTFADFHRKTQKFLLLLLFFLLAGLSAPRSAQAAAYARASRAEVSITSSSHGWVKIGRYYYYYNSAGRLLYGRIKYKGKIYYSYPSGRRATGWVKKGKKRYYFNPRTGVMYRSCWLTGTNYKFYFNAKGELTKRKKLPVQGNSKSHYTYNSSTLKIDLRRKSVRGASYWVAEIRIASAKQLRSALSYGSYGGTRQTTSDAVSSNRGIIGVNGSAFSYKTGKPSPLGMCIKNGIIYGNYMTSYSVLAVRQDGTMFTPAQGLMGLDLLAAGVKDTYNFGPVLINNGQAQPAWAETNKYYPRTAVGMIAPRHYVLLVTDTGSYDGLNHQDLVKIFLSYGCKYAYNLDGGGSATLYFNGKVMNNLINNYQRPCADFLYFTR